MVVVAKKKSKKQSSIKYGTKKTEEIEVEQPSFHPKEMNSFYAWDGDTLVLNILGTPAAKRDTIGKPKGNQLKISVRESPQGGKATDYMVRFLATEFGVSAKDIQVVFGRFNINKQVRIKNPKNLPSEIVREQPPKTGTKLLQKNKKW